MHIELQPVGQVDGSLLASLQAGLNDTIGFHVNTRPSIPVSAAAYHASRDQYLADDILSALRQIKSPDSYLLAVTDVNIFTHGTNFVFGLADPGSGIAVISLFLLRSHDPGDKPGSELLLQRTLKEAVHETGHLLGMGHCSNGECVMHFSGSLIDTDVKNSHFCANCQPRLII